MSDIVAGPDYLARVLEAAKVEGGTLFLRLELLGLRRVIERSFEDACVRVQAETDAPVYRVKLA